MATAAVRKELAIDLRVELALGDVIHSGWAVFAHRARIAILVYVLLLACAASALGLVASHGESSAVAALLWTITVVLLALPFAPVLFVLWSGKKRFDQASSQGHELHYRFSPNEIVVRNTSRMARIGWEELWEAIETKRCFLLFLSPEDYYVVPKRFFSNEADLAFVRGELREYLGVRAHLK